MSTAVSNEDNIIIKQFQRETKNYYRLVENDFNKFVKDELISLKDKYIYLKRVKRMSKKTKITKFKALISELLSDSYFTKRFSESSITTIYKYCIYPKVLV